MNVEGGADRHRPDQVVLLVPAATGESQHNVLVRGFDVSTSVWNRLAAFLLFDVFRTPDNVGQYGFAHS